MQNSKPRRELIPITVFIIISILVGLFIFQDYGESRDEEQNMLYGAHSLRNYGRIFQGKSPLNFVEYHLDYKGPAFFMGVSLVSALVRGLFSSVSQVESWHIVYFITFEISVFFMFLLARHFLGLWASFGTAALYGTQPLLWGHAFINPKDSPFMVFFLAAIILGFLAVDRSKSFLEFAKNQEGNPKSLKEMWSELDQKKQRRMILSWLVVLVLFLLIFILGQVFDSFMRLLVSRLYEADPVSLLGRLFSKFASQAANIPMESYISKGQILFRRLVWGGWVVLTGFSGWVTYRILTPARSWLPSEIVRSMLRFFKCPICLLAGTVLGLTISIRVLGFYALILVGLYALYILLERAPIFLIPCLILASAITYLTWPFLWDDPFRFYDSLTTMADYPWNGDVLFSGELIPSHSLPWTYLPKLILYQLTEPVVLLFIPGVVIALQNAFRKKSPVLIGLILFWFILPTAAIIVVSDNLYDNFRHILFVLPPVFIAGGLVLERLFGRIKKIGWRIVVLLVVLLPSIQALVALHPYQYTYFNGLAGGMPGAFRNYEMDYWLTSFKEMAHYLNDTAEPGAYVMVFGPEYMLERELRDDIQIIENDLEVEPDYAVVPARKNDDLLGCRHAPVIYEVRRSGAIFGVIKKPQTPEQCP